MPKKKKVSKLSKTINWLKPTSPAKGMLLFAIVFAVVGGALYLYKSQAATYYPPSKYTGHKTLNFTASDGVRATNPSNPTTGSVLGQCMSYKAQSAYGQFTRCSQTKCTNPNCSSAITRVLTHNFATGAYTVDSQWYNQADFFPMPPIYCINTGYPFTMIAGAKISNAFMYPGQQYRLRSDGAWMIDLANHYEGSASTSTYNCDEPDVWYRINGYW